MQERKRDPVALEFLGLSLARTRMLDLMLGLVAAALERDRQTASGSYSALVRQAIQEHRTEHLSAAMEQLDKLHREDELIVRRAFSRQLDELHGRLALLLEEPLLPSRDN